MAGSRRLRSAAVAAALLLGRDAGAQTDPGSPSGAVLGGPVVGGPCPDETAWRAAPIRPPHLGRKTAFLTVAHFGVVAAVGEELWWYKKSPRSFETASEGWFGRDTYAGGADKASHFMAGYFIQQALSRGYEWVGQPPARARLLSASVGALTGVLVEVADGFTGYRFSWEDAAITSLGAVTGALLEAARLDDTLGFRYGRVVNRDPEDETLVEAGNVRYSGEIYTFDVRMTGLLPRMGIRPGFGRFFMVSFTYGTKGYGFVREEFRQRNVGIDLSLDLPEILRAAGVRDRGLGAVVLWVLRYFRLPYTAVGWRYDLNHHRWTGPDTGDVYRP